MNLRYIDWTFSATAEAVIASVLAAVVVVALFA
jgi:hypothetical protein